MPSESLVVTFDNLIDQVSSDYPDLELASGSQFTWHAQHKRLSYQKTNKYTTKAIFSLLHELGHAVLEHNDYTYDIELLQMEAAAWAKARELANHYHISLNEDYAQDCLDTYRDWLHLRATCPTCFARSLQISEREYRCFNCRTRWQVSRSRLCRPYRLKTTGQLN